MSRLFCLLILLWPVLSAGVESVGRRVEYSDQVRNGDRFMQIRLLGSLLLSGSPDLSELSGLTWDEDEEILYAVTDRGLLLHLRPVIRNDRLRDLLLLARYPLLNRLGKPLKGHWRDSEGLAIENGDNGIKGDSRLLISFERHNRITRYTPSGQYSGTVTLPKGLEDPNIYPAFNEGLESVTLHPAHGPISGPEKAVDNRQIILFSGSGEKWAYESFEPDGGVVALETLPNGDILVMERSFSFPLSPMVISLSRFSPRADTPDSGVNSVLLARFDSTEGWRTQNFEGLTRHRGNRFFMVSDDAGYSLFETQLIYFEILN